MSDIRECRLSVAVSKSEAEMIRSTARSNDVTVSELIREVLVGNAEE